MEEYKFKVGDHVKRDLMYGIIIERYTKPKINYSSFSLGPYPELYRVKWDDGTVSGGFLPHGLRHTTHPA